jgi:hypothetical protein
MYTALELVQVNQEAGTCTEGATMKSSSYTHSSTIDSSQSDRKAVVKYITTEKIKMLAKMIWRR